MRRKIAMFLSIIMFSMNMLTVFAQEPEQSIENHLEEQAASVEENKDIEFVYIDLPYLELSETQNIVVAVQEEFATSEEVKLVVRKDNQTIEKLEYVQHIDNLYQFSKVFSDESEKGVYECISLELIQNGVQIEIPLTNLNASIKFGVNQEYEGYRDNVVLLGEETVGVEASVVTIDENGNFEEQKDISDALEDIGGMSTYGLRKRNIVVALDPGHDKRHAGAAKNGLLEQDLTLKIANYCKEELEKYSGIELYMTRIDAACPYPDTTTSAKCIEQRVIAARNMGASIYVSFHLNSQANGTGAHGAEVIYPNDSWKAELGQNGKELSEKILEKLGELGLHKRPIYSRDSTIGEKYPDGSKSDYYAVQRCGKENDIAGIIIEHAFISNTSDVNRFLKTEEGLKKLGIADADGIVEYLGLTLKGETDTEDEIEADVARLVGEDRYLTAFKAADELKKTMGVDKFDTVIVSCGTNFADALAGSYLAAKKEAPILLVRDDNVHIVKQYIENNLEIGGTVYLLGGTAVVPADMETEMNNFCVKRIWGNTRYDTNLAILNEAGINDRDILVCTGKSFADSLSASATGFPILLVNDALNNEQEDFLSQYANDIYIIGGTGAVNENIENTLKDYGNVTRIGGATRFETSTLVAKHFYTTPNAVVLAYSQNFPDGLSGGPLAYSIKAPLILTETGKEAVAVAYTRSEIIERGYVLGGVSLISDRTANKIFNLPAYNILEVK